MLGIRYTRYYHHMQLLTSSHPAADSGTGSALSTYRGRGSDIEAICGAALALIAVLKLDSRRVIVVGHAMGTIVASEMALYLNPLGIILIGPMNPSPELADVFAARGQLVQKGECFDKRPR